MLLLLYLVGLAYVLLNPSSEFPSRLVASAAEVGREAGLPAALLLPERAEFVANVLIIIPAAAAAAWVWPARSWADWTAYGYIGSMAVEAAQAVLFVGRSATYVDVVSNTLGALVGAVAGKAVHRMVARRRVDGDEATRAGALE